MDDFVAWKRSTAGIVFARVVRQSSTFIRNGDGKQNIVRTRHNDFVNAPWSGIDHYDHGGLHRGYCRR